MSAAATMPGGSGGFVNRITVLEREVAFLKSKVEEDARWKGILEKWMLDNFVFDLRAALIQASNPNRSSAKSSPKTQPQPERMSTRLSCNKQTQKRLPLLSESEGEGDDDDDAQSFDLIITPDIQGESQSQQEHQMNCKIEQVSIPRENEDCLSDADYPGGAVAVDGGDDDNDDDYDNASVSSSSSYKKKKGIIPMEWALVATYPDFETMQSSFPMRLWTGRGTTRTLTDGITKKNYYCRECRKNGPVRLQVRYRTPETEVEVYQNIAEHDHSKKRRINEDMKEEIFALFSAGVKSTTKIIEAMKISRPDLRVPTPKQVQQVLKKPREEERRQLAKEKKLKKQLAAKAKLLKLNKGQPKVKAISIGMSGSGSLYTNFTNADGGGNPPHGGSGQIPSASSTTNTLLNQQQVIMNPSAGLPGYDIHTTMQHGQPQQHISGSLYTNISTSSNMQQGLL